MLQRRIADIVKVDTKLCQIDCSVHMYSCTCSKSTVVHVYVQLVEESSQLVPTDGTAQFSDNTSPEVMQPGFKMLVISTSLSVFGRYMGSGFQNFLTSLMKSIFHVWSFPTSLKRFGAFWVLIFKIFPRHQTFEIHILDVINLLKLLILLINFVTKSSESLVYSSIVQLIFF